MPPIVYGHVTVLFKVHHLDIEDELEIRDFLRLLAFCFLSKIRDNSKGYLLSLEIQCDICMDPMLAPGINAWIS